MIAHLKYQSKINKENVHSNKNIQTQKSNIRGEPNPEQKQLSQDEKKAQNNIDNVIVR